MAKTELMFTCVYKLHRLNSLLEIKLGFFPSPFLISTSCFIILAEAFQNEHVAVFSNALRSATEKNEMGGYVAVPCSSKMTQRSSKAD